MIAIELSLRQLMDAVKQLSPAEKLELNEMIWKDDVAIPMEHQTLVNERINRSKANPETIQDWETSIKKLRA